MRDWLYWSRRITPWLFYTGSVLFFLACMLQYFRGAGFNEETFLLGALMGVAPGLIQFIEQRFRD